MSCFSQLVAEMEPSSCDTFVALPPSTEGLRIIFGKNSDRPCDEVQEVVYFAARDYGPDEKLEVGDTYSTSSITFNILSVTASY